MTYAVIKNSLMMQHKFVLSVLFKNIDEAIVVIGNKNPKCGKILKYMYLTREFEVEDNFTFPSNTIINIIDCAVNSVYSNSAKCRKLFYNECKEIGSLFHLSGTDVEFYYFLAYICYFLEMEYNQDKLDNTIFTEDQKTHLKPCIEMLKNSLSEIIIF